MVEYEGEFKSNLLGGKGKLFDQKGKLIYSGYFVEGKRNGFGIGFYRNGGKEFEGEWGNDLPNGYGALYSSLGVVMQKGEFLGGQILKEPYNYNNFASEMASNV